MQLGRRLSQAAGFVAELRHRKTWWPALAVGALVLMGLVTLGAYALDRTLASATVLRGVWAGKVTLSGLDERQARAVLDAVKKRIETTPLRVSVASRLFEVSPSEIGLTLDVNETLGRAMREGRSGGFLPELHWWLERWTKGVFIPLAVSVDAGKLNVMVDNWEHLAITDLPVPGGLVMDGLKPVAVYPTDGRRIDRQASREALMLHSEDSNIVALPVTVVTPELGTKAVQDAVARARQLLSGDVVLRDDAEDLEISFAPEDLARMLRSRPEGGQLWLYFDERAVSDHLDRVRSSLVASPVDAKFVISGPNDIKIEPSRTGTRIDDGEVANELLIAAMSAQRRGKLVVYRDAAPELTEEQARALNIRGLVSQFSTGYPCCQPRVKNIQRIAELLDGVVVQPGAVFSVNEHVGPRTVNNGFVAAPSIEDGEMVDTVGGGISQFATTFFNAVFHGGYDIIERQPHSYWFSRYPMGHEATLSWPKPDLMFRNDTKSGVLIKAHATSTRVTVLLYGDNEGRKVRANVSRRHRIVEPPVELVPNPALEPHREKVVESGTPGWTVDVSRTVVFADKTEKSEKRRVTYNPRPRRIEVHPCRIPQGEPGHTGELCPIPDSALMDEADEQTAFDARQEGETE